MLLSIPWPEPPSPLPMTLKQLPLVLCESAREVGKKFKMLTRIVTVHQHIQSCKFMQLVSTRRDVHTKTTAVRARPVAHASPRTVRSGRGCHRRDCTHRTCPGRPIPPSPALSRAPAVLLLCCCRAACTPRPPPWCSGPYTEFLGFPRTPRAIIVGVVPIDFQSTAEKRTSHHARIRRQRKGI